MTNIVRVKKRDKPYVILDKTGLQDKKLSWKAKGLLAYLISLPDDWVIHERELATHARDGRDSTRAALKELMDNCYVIRRQLRNDNEGEKGRFGQYETIVYEQPVNADEIPEEFKQQPKQQPEEEKSHNTAISAADGFSDHGETDHGETDLGKSVSGESDRTNKELDHVKKVLNPSTTTDDLEIPNDSSEKEFKTVYDAYLKCGWGLPSTFMIELIADDVESYGVEIVCHAMKIAAERNAKSYSYTKGIFRTWKEQGLTTMEQVQEYEDAETVRRLADSKRKQGNGGYNNGSTQQHRGGSKIKKVAGSNLLDF
jgi:DnaD/phage-associated family protein